MAFATCTVLLRIIGAVNFCYLLSKFTQGCKQVGKAISMPPTAVINGLIAVATFCMSHANVCVPATDRVEPVFMWIAIGMQTGSGKSPLYKFLLKILCNTQTQVGPSETSPPWLLHEATFEKMGAMMAENHCKLLGLYHELSSFLTQIYLCKRHGLGDSHDLAVFLQLYNDNPWSRKIGKKSC